jgi:hypothetical protein
VSSCPDAVGTGFVVAFRDAQRREVALSGSNAPSSEGAYAPSGKARPPRPVDLVTDAGTVVRQRTGRKKPGVEPTA